MKLLDRSFYARPTQLVAQELLGKRLIRKVGNITLSGIITETEAYGGLGDPASHAFTRQTSRNAAMFGPVGHSYIYFIYGNHYCLNLVAREEDTSAGAVLIRSIVPLDGVPEMKKARGIQNNKNLTNGPGKLCQALQITQAHNQHDVTQVDTLYVTEGLTISSHDILATPRIGITKAQDVLWRFVLSSSFSTSSELINR